MGDSDEAPSAAPSSSAAPQAQAQPEQQNITVTNRQLNITPFVIYRDPTNTANRWAKWKKDIERQFRFFGIGDSQLKKDGLIIYGGRDIADLEDSLPDFQMSKAQAHPLMNTQNSFYSWTSTSFPRKTKTTRDSNLVICSNQKTNHSLTTSLGLEISPRNANITMRTTPSAKPPNHQTSRAFI